MIEYTEYRFEKMIQINLIFRFVLRVLLTLTGENEESENEGSGY